MTEITIGSDGRLFVFGTSRRVLELLHEISPDDPRVTMLLSHLRSLERPTASARSMPRA